MNVQTKLQLSEAYESYWDMLSPEVQEYILEFKQSQEEIDEARKELMFSLCHEIKLFVKLKTAWGLGPIKLHQRHQCKHECNNELKISGHYVDEDRVKKDMFLGYGYQQALARVNHVKSFL